MDSVALITIADLLADDVTPTATHEPNLADFFDAARPVDDDGELLAVTAALLRLRNTVDHALARGAATIERVGLPARKHVRSAVGILTELGAAPAVAYRAARLGRACGDTTVGAVTRGMRDGAVSAELGDAVVTGLDHVDDRAVLSEDDRSRVLHSLLVQTTPARVKEKAHAWAIRLAPATGDDGQVPVAERDDLNAMTLDRTDDGRVAVTVDLDVVAGEELSAALDPLTRPVPEPDGSEDKRSAKRRRADAFTHIVRTFLSHSDRPESGGVLPHVTLTVPAAVVADGRLVDAVARPEGDQSVRLPRADLDADVTGVPSLGFSGPVSARTAELVMCDASVALALLDEHGVPLNVGREKRLFPPGLRKALAIRDHGCAFPGCGLPPSWCDAHHAEHWENGGPTCLDNGVLLCRRHHTLIHHGGWQVFIGHDRHPWFVPPADPDHPKQRTEPIPSNSRRTLTLLPGAA
ncbi:HNH endonuclease [Gordonia iterans]|uniref:HNH endonuclease n=1 Tax=Gordonia iterans TaxID=1004901 RepID=A0A2S0KEB6_9ACTN|nr:HNH endonuclease signature motif containing protein [Gordonia iterans]AVL99993.1 HNH endonuclease [Gordonia iterans]